jgi:hypothetical protein
VPDLPRRAVPAAAVDNEFTISDCSDPSAIPHLGAVTP